MIFANGAIHRMCFDDDYYATTWHSTRFVYGAVLTAFKTLNIFAFFS
jgi:hypothetical protein